MSDVRIQWTDLPEALRVHLFLRARERAISGEDLPSLRAWRESAPDAPDGPGFRDFGSFKICGEGRFPKTFLMRGQPARGRRLCVPVRGGVSDGSQCALLEQLRPARVLVEWPADEP